MILDSIDALKERNGSSSQTILRHIKANYAVEENCDKKVRLAIWCLVGRKKLLLVKGKVAPVSFKVNLIDKSKKKFVKAEAKKTRGKPKVMKETDSSSQAIEVKILLQFSCRLKKLLQEFREETGSVPKPNNLVRKTKVEKKTDSSSQAIGVEIPLQLSRRPKMHQQEIPKKNCSVSKPNNLIRKHKVVNKPDSSSQAIGVEIPLELFRRPKKLLQEIPKEIGSMQKPNNLVIGETSELLVSWPLSCLDSKTVCSIDLKRLSQLKDMGNSEHYKIIKIDKSKAVTSKGTTVNLKVLMSPGSSEKTAKKVASIGTPKKPIDEITAKKQAVGKSITENGKLENTPAEK